MTFWYVLHDVKNIDYISPQSWQLNEIVFNKDIFKVNTENIYNRLRILAVLYIVLLHIILSERLQEKSDLILITFLKNLAKMLVLKLIRNQCCLFWSWIQFIIFAISKQFRFKQYGAIFGKILNCIFTFKFEFEIYFESYWIEIYCFQKNSWFWQTWTEFKDCLYKYQDMPGFLIVRSRIFIKKTVKLWMT